MSGTPIPGARSTTTRSPTDTPADVLPIPARQILRTLMRELFSRRVVVAPQHREKRSRISVRRICAADSTDAYAGTFLSVVWNYYNMAGADQAYVQSIQPQLDNIGKAVLFTQDTDGLTWALP